jgi:membrane fusion protein (multidrug efflux system)
MGKGTVVVPQSAVKELQGTYTVGVVGPDDTVQVRTVEMGPRSAHLWAVTKGLNPGERVVTEGMQKVSDGQKVVPQADPSAAAVAEGARAPDAGG